ncbi:MAG: radical SAM protein [Kofleriaceae bacterium]|nr:radical SAM protein [Myxococcales bacterium]MCB9564963.1 radical SAM protein [Kofleriaceae bacterium]
MTTTAFTRLRRSGRVLRDLALAALDPDRPVVANLIVTRRCNLSCGYCFEHDRVSPPVPLEVLRDRIDHLARLRTVMVTLTGGEALLHPDLVALVAHVAARGMTPLVNTNGYLLTRDRIVALDRAGLFGMQISVDNVEPNPTSKKSLRLLLPKLRLLAAHATFRVRVAAVLDGAAPEEAVAVARAALALGFDTKSALVRDAAGAYVPMAPAARAAYDQIRRLGRRAPAYLSEDFQVALLRDGRVDWKCRAGARYFHVCEDGLVHLCSSNRGAPGTPLATYDVADLRRAFALRKRCADTCTQPYAHQISRLDRLRRQDQPPARAPVRLPVLA